MPDDALRELKTGSWNSIPAIPKPTAEIGTLLVAQERCRGGDSRISSPALPAPSPILAAYAQLGRA